jgi:hypothetical protein
LVFTPQKKERRPAQWTGECLSRAPRRTRMAGETSRAHAQRLERGLAAGQLVTRVTYPS